MNIQGKVALVTGGAVRVGKYLEIELTNSDPEAARQQIDAACHKILSNPVIEDYRFEIE